MNVGARPVFADVDRDSQNITAETVAAALTPATKAVVCVHLAGWPCDMDAMAALAEQHGLYLIEDCAQAHGATWRGRPVGGFGHVGCWSFCQDKIMTTGGEGGMVTTNDRALWSWRPSATPAINATCSWSPRSWPPAGIGTVFSRPCWSMTCPVSPAPVGGLSALYCSYGQFIVMAGCFTQFGSADAKV